MKIDINKVSSIIRDVAGRHIRTRFVTLETEDIGEKRPDDFVTVVDLAVEAELAAALTKLAPGTAVIGEEAVAKAPHRLPALLSQDDVWVIDPLDGTANYAAGMPLCAVIVALLRRGETVAGWLHDPMTDRMYVGQRGAGTWLEDRRLTISPPESLRDMNGSVYGRAFRNSEGFGRLWGSGRGELGRVFNARCVAQEYMARLLGRTHFGLYTRLNAWDHAAGCLLHVEAGGVARLIDGSPYRPGQGGQGLLVAPDERIWKHLHQKFVSHAMPADTVMQS